MTTVCPVHAYIPVFGLTGILEVDVVPVVGIAELVGHHPQGHDLLPDESVRPRNVHLHLRVVQLVGQAILHHLWEISEEEREEPLDQQHRAPPE